MQCPRSWKPFFYRQDSESSEEEEGISEEDLKKTKGWERLIKNLQAITDQAKN